MPALPLDEAGKYVAAAYLVFLALILVYVAIMAAKLARIDRELGELADVAEGRSATNPPGADAGADQAASRQYVRAGAEQPGGIGLREPRG
jgi:uncharacterized membrane protein